MNTSMEPVSAGDLRAQVAQLRHELDSTVRSYHAAKRNGDSDLAINLLRQKSALIRQLFEAQSALLLLFRSEGQAHEGSWSKWRESAFANQQQPPANEIGQ